MKRGIGKLYHLAEASNLASILQHGLMSTERLLDLACVAKPERDVLLRVHRPDNIRGQRGDPRSTADATRRRRARTG